MANAFRVKTDLINELKNKIYYNQLEVQRLLENPTTYSHVEVIARLTDLLAANVTAANSIELMEQYLPAPPKQQVQEPVMDVNEEGVTKVQ
jgi:hypothetical protein